MLSATVFLGFVASALAYSITSPSPATGWTTSGPNVVSWTMVSSDPSNFTIVLDNQQVHPEYTQILDALVVGSDGSITVNPPSGGWVAGSGYRVNIVQDATHLDALLAQSQTFNITQTSSSTFSSSTSASSSSSVSSVSITSSGSSAPITSGTSVASGSTGAALNPTSSDTSTSPTGTNAAAPAMGMQAGLLGLLTFLGMALI